MRDLLEEFAFLLPTEIGGNTILCHQDSLEEFIAFF